MIEIGESRKEVEEKTVQREGEEACQACGIGKEEEKLSRCKGCESVWYCNKVGESESSRWRMLTVHRSARLWAGMRGVIKANVKFIGQLRRCFQRLLG